MEKLHYDVMTLYGTMVGKLSLLFVALNFLRSKSDNRANT